jgi:hypothetical protein
MDILFHPTKSEMWGTMTSFHLKDFQNWWQQLHKTKLPWDPDEMEFDRCPLKFGFDYRYCLNDL